MKNYKYKSGKKADMLANDLSIAIVEVPAGRRKIKKELMMAGVFLLVFGVIDIFLD